MTGMGTPVSLDATLVVPKLRTHTDVMAAERNVTTTHRTSFLTATEVT